MRLVSACLPIVLLVSPGCSIGDGATGRASSASPLATEDDLLEFLTLELEQARRRISSVVYEYEFEAIHYVSLKGRLGSSGGGAVKQKGEKRSTVFRRTTSIDGKTGREVVAKSVLNEEYFAGQPYQHNIPVRYERRAADLSLERFDLRRQLLGGFDFLRYGFGSGHETLREARAHPDRSFRWEVEETLSSNGSPLFIVKRFTPLVADPDTPTFEWVIDPSKGFLITTVRVRAIDGDIGLEHVIRVEKVGNEGVWFPTEVHETAYEPWVRGADKLKGDFFVASDGRSIARSKTFRITALEVNVPISDDEFTAEKAFGLRDGSSIAHMSASGEAEVYYYVGGVAVPKEVYDDSRRPP